MAQRKRASALVPGGLTAAMRAGGWARLVLAFLAALATWSRPAGASAADLGFRLIEQAVPEDWCPGEGRLVPIRIANAGTSQWNAEHPRWITYRWLDKDGGFLDLEAARTRLSEQVRPDSTTEVAARVFAPTVPGDYRLRWAMEDGSVSRFASGGDAPATISVGGRNPVFDWDIEVVRQPERFAARERATVEVRITNRGCAAWSARWGDRLAYHWYSVDGELVTFEGARTALPDIKPGEQVTIVATVVGPDDPGRYRLVWEPVREHIGWYGQRVSGHEVEVGPPDLAWSVLGFDLPAEIEAGQWFDVVIELSNSGRAPWDSSVGDALSYHWVTPDGSTLVWEGHRTPLLNVAPGASVRVDARVRAPEQPGQYSLVWEPVREHVRWYGSPDPAAVSNSIRLQVAPARLAWELESIDLPSFLWKGRPATARVALRNTGTESWSPEQNDRVSYRWFRDGQNLGDGARTELPSNVAPGEVVELELRVVPPLESGEYDLELGMVREHVRWFPRPRGNDIVYPLRVVSSAAILVTAAFFMALALAFVIIRGRRNERPWVLTASSLLWPLWTVVVAFFLTQLFVDLSGIGAESNTGWSAMSVAAAAGLVIASVPGRAQVWIAVGSSCFLAALTFADLLYMRFFGTLVPVGAMAASHHLKDTVASVRFLTRTDDWQIALLPAATVVLWIACFRGAHIRSQRRLAWSLRFLLAAAGLPAMVTLASAAFGVQGTRVFSESQNARAYGHLGAHVLQVVRTVRERIAGLRPLSVAARAEIQGELVEARSKDGGPDFGIAKGHNLLVLQVEALQEWVIDAEVGAQEITPFLNRSRGGAIYFPHVFDQTAQGRTSDAEYLVLNSGHALDAGALSFLRQDNEFLTIAHVLSEHGYTTISAHPYKRGFWNRGLLHRRYGFESSLFEEDFAVGTHVGWGLSDAAFLEQMAGRLGSLREPFFGFLITLSLHHPYEDFPEKLKILDVGRFEGAPLGNYLHAMHLFDAALADFFARLQSAGLLSRTVVVVYGDHVTGLGVPAGVLELAGIETWDPSVATRLHRVPLFIWVPGERRGTIEGVGGQVDIGATLLEVLGIRIPTTFFGRSLLPRPPGFAALPSGESVGNDYLLVEGGEAVPAAGGCYSFVGGTPLPRERCRLIEERAARQVRTSRAILNYDLHRRFGGAATH